MVFEKYSTSVEKMRIRRNTDVGLKTLQQQGISEQVFSDDIFYKEALAIWRTFSLVDMITNTKFSNCPKVFKIGVVWQ